MNSLIVLIALILFESVYPFIPVYWQQGVTHPWIGGKFSGKFLEELRWRGKNLQFQTSVGSKWMLAVGNPLSWQTLWLEGRVGWPVTYSSWQWPRLVLGTGTRITLEKNQFGWFCNSQMLATTQLSPERRLVKCMMGRPYNRMEGMCVLCSDSHSSEKNEVKKGNTE